MLNSPAFGEGMDRRKLPALHIQPRGENAKLSAAVNFVMLAIRVWFHLKWVAFTIVL